MPPLGGAELQQARERFGSLFGQSAEAPAEAGHADAEIAQLLERARAKLDTAGEEDRNELVDLIEAIEDAEASGDAAALEQAKTQLTDLLFYLET